MSGGPKQSAQDGVGTPIGWNRRLVVGEDFAAASSTAVPPSEAIVFATATRSPAKENGGYLSIQSDGSPTPATAPGESAFEVADALDKSDLGEFSDSLRERRGHQAAAQSSIPRAIFNIVKGNVGAGIFLLPTIYTEAGYILGPFFAVTCGLVIIDCSLMLLRCKRLANLAGWTDVQTYPQTAAFVFGGWMEKLVKVELVVTQLGFVLLYLQFASSVFEGVVSFEGAYHVYVLVATFLILPMTFLSNRLHYLAFASLIAICCIVYCVTSTMVLSFIHFEPSQGEIVVKDAAVAPSPKWLLFFASQMTVLEGIGVVLPIENSLKDGPQKDRFPIVLRNTLLGIVLLYLIYGELGYLSYGTALTESLVNILAAGPFADTIKIALSCELILTAPLQFSPAIQLVDQIMNVPQETLLFFHLRAAVPRVVIMLILMGIAMALPPDTVSLVLAFIGALAATFLGMTLPALLDLYGYRAVLGVSLSWVPRLDSTEVLNAEVAVPDAVLAQRPTTARRVRGVAYFTFSIIIMLIGTAACVIEATELN